MNKEKFKRGLLALYNRAEDKKAAYKALLRLKNVTNANEVKEALIDLSDLLPDEEESIRILASMSQGEMK